MNIEVQSGSVIRLDQYARVPMLIRVSARLALDSLWLGEFQEVHMTPYEKDYDSLEPVLTITERFDTTHWGMLSAFVDGQRAGGAIIAWNSPDLDMLLGREDLAVLWDIRVSPEFQGEGVGRRLFETALEWARGHQCTELHVETQDVNVGACRFYRAMGCRVHSIEPKAYLELNEAKIIFGVGC